MALIPDGNEFPTLTGANRPGKDMEDNRVIVSATHEAINDYGWRTIWQAAETKYSDGNFEDNGGTRLVSVTTADCAAEES